MVQIRQTHTCSATDIFISTFPWLAFILFYRLAFSEASSLLCYFFVLKSSERCVCVGETTCITCTGSFEPGIQPCFSLSDAGAFGGVFSDSFCQRMQCTDLYLCLRNTSSVPVVGLIPVRSPHWEMKAHLSCYHSTMTEHKVIPVHELLDPFASCASKWFHSPFFHSLSPLMSCMTAGFCICLLSCWSDAIRFGILCGLCSFAGEDCLCKLLTLSNELTPVLVLDRWRF